MVKLAELVKLENGKLRLQLTEDGKAERAGIRAWGFGIGYAMYLDYWLEWEVCNGWDLLRPDEIGALTSEYNTLLTDTASRNDYGELIDVRTVWYDNFYAVRDPVTELLTEGYVDFWPSETEGTDEAVASGADATSANAASHL